MGILLLIEPHQEYRNERKVQSACESVETQDKADDQRTLKFQVFAQR
jgi:hypothetical protein